MPWRCIASMCWVTGFTTSLVANWVSLRSFRSVILRPFISLTGTPAIAAAISARCSEPSMMSRATLSLFFDFWLRKAGHTMSSSSRRLLMSSPQRRQLSGNSPAAYLNLPRHFGHFKITAILSPSVSPRCLHRQPLLVQPRFLLLAHERRHHVLIEQGRLVNHAALLLDRLGLPGPPLDDQISPDLGVPVMHRHGSGDH